MLALGLALLICASGLRFDGGCCFSVITDVVCESAFGFSLLFALSCCCFQISFLGRDGCSVGRCGRVSTLPRPGNGALVGFATFHLTHSGVLLGARASPVVVHNDPLCFDVLAFHMFSVETSLAFHTFLLL
ncbi:hypothetical protein Dimus_007332 [Dionaea muscipula]